MTPTWDPRMQAVVAHLAAARPEVAGFSEDTDLIESGVLDSLGMIDLLLVLEEVTGDRISLDTVAAQDFASLGSIRQRFFGGSREP